MERSSVRLASLRAVGSRVRVAVHTCPLPSARRASQATPRGRSGSCRRPPPPPPSAPSLPTATTRRAPSPPAAAGPSRRGAAVAPRAAPSRAASPAGKQAAPPESVSSEGEFERVCGPGRTGEQRHPARPREALEQGRLGAAKSTQPFVDGTACQASLSRAGPPAASFAAPTAATGWRSPRHFLDTS